MEIEKTKFKPLRNIIKKSISDYFLTKNLIVCDDFIGGLRLLEGIDSRVEDLERFKKFTIRIFHPKQQHTCYEGNIWCLSVFYEGEVEITKKPLKSYENHGIIKRVLVKNKKIKKLSELTEDEKISPETKIIVNKEFLQIQNLNMNFSRSEK